MQRRSWWGWGREDDALGPEQIARLAAGIEARFGVDLDPVPPPQLDEIHLPPPRFAAPVALQRLLTDDPWERAGHTYGKSFRDVVRAFRREMSHPPDFVALPADEAELTAVLEWCSEHGIAAIPYGGGSSVVGGVEADVPSYDGAVSIDMRRMAGVVEVDRRSRAAHIRAGTYGPALEGELRPHGLTLRHYPQSFEFSTLGGWLATRSGGHYATNYTHIDDFVESLRIVTPAGVVESRRLPGSGAGPSPDRMFLGSEGALGVITEAWMRLQDRPTHRAAASVRFAEFGAGVEAARAVAQAGLFPANARLLDPGEAGGAGAGAQTVLLLGFESADHPVEAWLARALELAKDMGGTVPDVEEDGDEPQRAGAAGAWRDAFLRAPYGRDALVSLGVISETFETAITWERFEALHTRVVEATMAATLEQCGAGSVTCRFTHVYPDGPAPYYTVLAPGRRGAELEQWAAIKAAASGALLAAGGTITHHHAVGRDHRPWYDAQRPDGFARALGAVKRTFDPAGVMNPGVLIDGRP